MALPPEERAEIARKLLLSLEPQDFDENVDEPWADEIRRRLKAIREGGVTLLDWDESLAEIRHAVDSPRDK